MMARGWESKSVEEQRQAAATARTGKIPTATSPAQQERRRKREELELARKRILADLDAARHPRHRELLQRTLAELETRITALGGEV
jgi:hypothetical protein